MSARLPLPAAIILWCVVIAALMVGLALTLPKSTSRTERDRQRIEDTLRREQAEREAAAAEALERITPSR